MADEVVDQVPAGDEHEDGNGHVHFPKEQVITHESEILIKKKGDEYHIHLGFLQFLHRYQITFCICDSLNEDIEAKPLENLYVQMESYKPKEDGTGHQIVVLFEAKKEKLMEERITVTDSKDESKTITLVFHARILGKGQGTPSLRNGIHLMCVNKDEESEGSDWQGFD